MEDIQKKFNLPKYIHGKSFADASKLIEKKFDGRTDKEAMDTKNDLMSRLRDAQEYLKEAQAYKEESSRPQEPTHTMPDGTVMPGEQHQYMHGGYKKTNDYNHGGPHNVMPPDDLTEFLKRNAPRTEVQGVTNEIPTYEAAYPDEANPQFALEDNKTPSLDGSDPTQYEIQKAEGLGDTLNQEEVKSLANNNEVPTLTPEMVINMSSSSEGKGKGKEKKGLDKDKISKLLTTAGGLVPSAMNLAQLASLKKAGKYQGAKLNSTYEKQITDEAALQNAQAVESRAQRNAMRSNSGSQAMLLNNLRGQGLNALKAQGDAYMKSRLNNQEENRRQNAFNARQEEANVAYSRQDDMINMQNEGAYDSTKSALMAGLATDVGKMSKEALFKKYPELMGMDYDWLGKFSGKDKKKKNKNKTQDS
jgi:hypothetical protein